MNKRMFFKGLQVLSQDGRHVDNCLTTESQEISLYIYLGKKDWEWGRYKYLYGRLRITNQLISSDGWKAVFRKEYLATREDMYETAKKEFSGSLRGVISVGSSSAGKLTLKELYREFLSSKGGIQ